jgi:hypothetical protein
MDTESSVRARTCSGDIGTVGQMVLIDLRHSVAEAAARRETLAIEDRVRVTIADGAPSSFDMRERSVLLARTSKASEGSNESTCAFAPATRACVDAPEAEMRAHVVKRPAARQMPRDHRSHVRLIVEIDRIPASTIEPEPVAVEVRR